MDWSLVTYDLETRYCLFTSIPINMHEPTALIRPKALKQSQSQSHIATDGQSVSKSWCQAPSGTHDQIFSYYNLTVTVLFLWGALSDKRMGRSFVYAAGSSQRSLSRVRVPWYLRPYLTVSDLRLPFSSPLTTRRVTVEDYISN
jgi:hypothetical protein